MSQQMAAILSLEVPVIVQIGERSMTMQDVLRLVPGSIIELPKRVEEPVDLLVDAKQIGTGEVVKVGENFGVRVKSVMHSNSRAEVVVQAASTATTSSSPEQPEKD